MQHNAGSKHKSFQSSVQHKNQQPTQQKACKCQQPLKHKASKQQ